MFIQWCHSVCLRWIRSSADILLGVNIGSNIGGERHREGILVSDGLLNGLCALDTGELCGLDVVGVVVDEEYSELSWFWVESSLTLYVSRVLMSLFL